MVDQSAIGTMAYSYSYDLEFILFFFFSYLH